MVSRILTVVFALGLTLTFAPGSASADSCDTDCGGPSCLASTRCPKSGIECYVDDTPENRKECTDAAEAKGYELRCERNYAVYCDPNEADPEADAEEDGGAEDGAADEDGCTVRSPRRSVGRGSGIAVVVFAVAAVATGFRAAARRRR